MPFLELNGQRRELANGELTAGSGAQADWRVTSADLAARHFTVVLREGEVRVRPYSAQHVLVVNGAQVGLHGILLRHGDVLAAGNARFRYLDRADEDIPPAPESAQRAWLIDDRRRRAYELTTRPVSIGRDSASTIIVRDPMVSRFHADIRPEAGGYVLYSMGSAGSRINGSPVSAPQVLQEGDRLGVGDAMLVFTRQPPPPEIESRTADDEIDAETSRRSTMVKELSSITGETGHDSLRRRVPVAMWVAIGLGVIAVIYFIVLR